MNKIKELFSRVRPFLGRTKSIVIDTAKTYHELLALLATTVIVGGGAYSLFEGRNILEGLFWAFKTTFIVGYGDMKPNTLAAQSLGSLLMTISIFVVVPMITALMVTRLMQNKNFTPEEKKTTRKRKK